MVRVLHSLTNPPDKGVQGILNTFTHTFTPTNIHSNNTFTFTPTNIHTKTERKESRKGRKYSG